VPDDVVIEAIDDWRFRCGTYLGHAQKWLNMTFKYIYVMGEQRVSSFGHLYDLCHVPLDNILIEALRKEGFQPLACPWSRLKDYTIPISTASVGCGTTSSPLRSMLSLDYARR
jgi:hypothetical protein